MATGTIMSIQGRGFGFIARDRPGPRGNGVFFHRSGVEGDGFDRLREGQRVRFDEGQDPRDSSRRRAFNVEPLEAADAGGRAAS